MGLVKILESRGIMPRHDVADALKASNDLMYPGQQSNLYTPQLIYAATWAEENISAGGDGDKVLLMGWASLGKRALGAPKLGMFIVTKHKFCFVRKDDSAGHVEQVYDIGKISNPTTSGILGLRKLTFVASEDKKEHMLERIQKENCRSIMAHMQ
mmetsp:Transcript_16227/g.30614  ORF Transcript_16227/g.30614 Transcript_16227/m.30614 type:complete len:155 (-) Transcript_16227:131-595(-)|eukprot:CAMPEP_0197452308 /NCGR_PEP_ID=MMETSP1175-20131217/31771_1 /TAXON_ID=1003142 /ORGANISM="Triceratium dubium, Strain CCMP147" /LENGTH=154 /DNA_ID=CAMNT_0042985287 /DNA_START=150 /DNA_END=614 /DNA_ORIENTATION=-